MAPSASSELPLSTNPNAAWPACIAVRDEFDLDHVAAVLGEQLADLLLVSAEGKVADIQSGAHAGTPGSPYGSGTGSWPPDRTLDPDSRAEAPLLVMARNSIVSVRQECSQDLRER